MGRAGVLVLALSVLASSALAEPGNPPPPEEGFLRRTPRVGEQRWLTLLCRFPDQPEFPHDPAWYRDVMGGSAHGQMADYWSEVSFGDLTIDGSDVAGPFELPRPSDDYFRSEGGGVQLSEQLLRDDCTRAAEASVDFREYDGLALWANAWLRGQDWGGQWLFELDGETSWYHGVVISGTREFPNAVVAHEMGHSFGWPHSGSEQRDQYGSEWDVMSGMSRGCRPADHPEWCIPVHPIAFWKYLAGWIPDSSIRTVARGETVTVKLSPLEGPRTSDGYLMVKVPILASPARFLTLEARRQRGYDAPLPGTETGIALEGVIVHRIDLWAFGFFAQDDSPGDTDLRLDETVREVGETYRDPIGGIVVTVDRETEDGSFVVTIDSPALRPVPNDSPAAATDLSGADASADVETYRATFSEDEEIVGCGQREQGHVTWYRYRPDEDGLVDVTTAGSDHLTIVGAYALEDGVRHYLGCANPAGEGPRTTFADLPVKAGQDYLFAVGSFFWWEGGKLHVEASLTPAAVETSIHTRVVDLRTDGHLKASGRGYAGAQPPVCTVGETVLVQRRKGRRWITVARAQVTTWDGDFAADLADVPGRYRAVMRRAAFSNHVCARSTSPVLVHAHDPAG